MAQQRIERLNNLVDKRASDLSKLREEIKRYSQENEILNMELNQVGNNLREMQVQNRDLIEENNRLCEDIYQRNLEISQLNDQLKKYSKVRILNGKYIGNLSDRNSKYHFDSKCNHWKMLVGEYVLGLDSSREIVSSSTATFFIGKLEECDRCSGRRN